MGKPKIPQKFTKPFGDDTERTDATVAVREAVREAARSQGGTTPTDSYAGSEKGNSDPIDMERGERVNSDPQLFNWNDRPRADNAGDVEGYPHCY